MPLPPGVRCYSLQILLLDLHFVECLSRGLQVDQVGLLAATRAVPQEVRQPAGHEGRHSGAPHAWLHMAVGRKTLAQNGTELPQAQPAHNARANIALAEPFRRLSRGPLLPRHAHCMSRVAGWRAAPLQGRRASRTAWGLAPWLGLPDTACGCAYHAADAFT